MHIDFSLNDELATELREAARNCGATPRQFALEAVEATLATRRLDRLPATPLAARVPEFKEGEL
jgi:hypothetical protein